MLVTGNTMSSVSVAAKSKIGFVISSTFSFSLAWAKKLLLRNFLTNIIATITKVDNRRRVKIKVVTIS